MSYLDTYVPGEREEYYHISPCEKLLQFLAVQRIFLGEYR